MKSKSIRGFLRSNVKTKDLKLPTSDHWQFWDGIQWLVHPCIDIKISKAANTDQPVTVEVKIDTESTPKQNLFQRGFPDFLEGVSSYVNSLFPCFCNKI